MTTAFQSNAFQNNGFQIDGAGNSQYLEITLDDVTVEINQSLRHTQLLAITLDSIVVSGAQINGNVIVPVIIGGGIDHQIKRRKATLSDKPNLHLDKIIEKAFKTVFGELTDKKASKEVQKQANKIVKEYTEVYRPKVDEIDWEAFNNDLQAVQLLFNLYQREITDNQKIIAVKKLFDLIENDNIEFLLMMH